MLAGLRSTGRFCEAADATLELGTRKTSKKLDPEGEGS